MSREELSSACQTAAEALQVLSNVNPAGIFQLVGQSIGTIQLVLKLVQFLLILVTRFRTDYRVSSGRVDQVLWKTSWLTAFPPLVSTDLESEDKKHH